MLLLYGRHYPARFRALAGLIEEGSSVLDLCCGPAHLYTRYLAGRKVDYTGLDLNPRFISRLRRHGGHGEVWNLLGDRALPAADTVVMQASLYHFLPDPAAVVDRMLAAARRAVIIAEPVRNLSSSRWALLRWIGRSSTDPGSGEQPGRFDEPRLDAFFEAYRERITRTFLIAGGREKVFVLAGRGLDGQTPASDRGITMPSWT